MTVIAIRIKFMINIHTFIHIYHYLSLVSGIFCTLIIHFCYEQSYILMAEMGD